MDFCIYMILNNFNGKFYIGSAINLQRRTNVHINALRSNKHHSQHLQNAWNIYGEGAFEFIIIEIVKDITKLYEIEQLWIDRSNCCHENIGYNMNSKARGGMPGNTHTKGMKHSEETKKKMSLQRKGKPFSLEVRLKRKSRRHTEETKNKMRESNLGKTRPKFTNIHKERMSKAAKGRKHTEETMAKLKGRKMSDATKLKMSISARKRWGK